jgi:hypothetical protein
VLRDALAKTNKIALGQLIMHGREHLVGITAHKNGLVLLILRRRLSGCPGSIRRGGEAPARPDRHFAAEDSTTSG